MLRIDDDGGSYRSADAIDNNRHHYEMVDRSALNASSWQEHSSWCIGTTDLLTNCPNRRHQRETNALEDDSQVKATHQSVIVEPASLLANRSIIHSSSPITAVSKLRYQVRAAYRYSTIGL